MKRPLSRNDIAAIRKRIAAAISSLEQANDILSKGGSPQLQWTLGVANEHCVNACTLAMFDLYGGPRIWPDNKAIK